MTNTDTDTVEAVTLLPCPFCNGPACLDEIPPHTHGALARFMPDHLGSFTIECDPCGLGLIDDDKARVIARWNRRAAIAAMPGNGEAMREAAAKVATAEAWKRREYAASSDNGELAQRELAAAQTCADLAAAIRALPLPQGGGSAAPAGWKLVPIEPTPEMMEVAWSHAPLDMEDMSDGHYGQAYKDMLAAAPLPPAVEPYAWLCTSPELDPVIVYGRENAETYAAHPERWTVEALYRGPKLAAPLPPAQEG